MDGFLRGFKQISRRKIFALALLVLGSALVLITACVPSELTARGSWGGALLVDDAVYSLGGDGRILRFDTTTSGTLDTTWTYPPSLQMGFGATYAPVVADEGNLYVTGYACGANNSNCVAQIVSVEIDAENANQNQRWARQLNTRIVGGMAVHGDTLLVATSSQIDEAGADGVLLGLDKDNNGTELWRITLESPVWSGITVAGGVAYFATVDGVIHAVNLEGVSGVPTITWQVDTENAIFARPVVADGRLYVGSFGGDGTFYALDVARRGAEVWTFDTGDWIWGEALLIDGNVYVGNVNGDLYALNADNGGEVWAVPTEFDSPIIGGVGDAGGGLLAVPLYDSSTGVMLVNASAGNLTGAVFNTAVGVAATPLMVDDLIYIQNLAGQTMVFNRNTAALQGCGAFANANGVTTITVCSNTN